MICYLVICRTSFINKSPFLFLSVCLPIRNKGAEGQIVYFEEINFSFNVNFCAGIYSVRLNTI